MWLAGLLTRLRLGIYRVGKDNWGSGTYTHPLRSRPGLSLLVEQVVMTSTAGVVWDASKGLCDFLEAKPELVRGQRVIELGCGTALPGMVAAVLGASSVVLTDMDEVLDSPRQSVERNRAIWEKGEEAGGAPGNGHGHDGSDDATSVAMAAAAVAVEPLMWGEAALPPSIVGPDCGDVDVVLAADVLGATADGMIDGANLTHTHARARSLSTSRSCRPTATVAFCSPLVRVALS